MALTRKYNRKVAIFDVSVSRTTSPPFVVTLELRDVETGFCSYVDFFFHNLALMQNELVNFQVISGCATWGEMFIQGFDAEVEVEYRFDGGPDIFKFLTVRGTPWPLSEIYGAFKLDDFIY